MTGLSAPSYKIVAGGSLGGSQDWSISQWAALSGGAAPTQNDVTTDAGNLASIIGTWWGHVKADCAPTTTLDHVSVYYYPSGALVSALLGHDQFAAIPGTGAAAALPTQLSLVHSMRSSTPGRSGRGRFYFPLTAADNIASAQMGSGRLTALGGYWLTMVHAINALASSSGQSMDVSVASFTKGVLLPVVSLVLDSKIDTQRRREDKVGALFVATSVV